MKCDDWQLIGGAFVTTAPQHCKVWKMTLSAQNGSVSIWHIFGFISGFGEVYSGYGYKSKSWREMMEEAKGKVTPGWTDQCECVFNLPHLLTRQAAGRRCYWWCSEWGEQAARCQHKSAACPWATPRRRGAPLKHCPCFSSVWMFAHREQGAVWNVIHTFNLKDVQCKSALRGVQHFIKSF